VVTVFVVCAGTVEQTDKPTNRQVENIVPPLASLPDAGIKINMELLYNKKSYSTKRSRELCLRQIYLRPRVTLNFDLPTPKVDRFMQLLRGTRVPICINIGSFVFRISCPQVRQQKNGQASGGHSGLRPDEGIKM